MLLFAVVYFFWRKNREHAALQKRMKENHPDLQFFMEHIETFMRFYDDIEKCGEICNLRFSKDCRVIATQINGGSGKVHSLGLLLKEYTTPDSGWRKDDFYVVSGTKYVLSGRRDIVGWDNQRKEWQERGDLKPRTTVFEEHGRVDNAELSELFEKLKEIRKSS